MGMPRRQPITEKQLQGFKYFKKLLPLLDRLHDHRVDRDRAGNRVLHYDQYLALMLLFFFNPIVTSMRGLVQASSLNKVRQKLGVSPTSLGSFVSFPHACVNPREASRIVCCQQPSRAEAHSDDEAG